MLGLLHRVAQFGQALLVRLLEDEFDLRLDCVLAQAEGFGKVQRVIDQRSTRNRDQRFRPVFCQLLHAGAKACRENHYRPAH